MAGKGPTSGGHSAARSTAHRDPGAFGEVGQHLAQLARELQQQESPQAVMDRIVSAAVVLVPGAQEASISRVVKREHVRSEAATSDRARRFDQLQEEAGEGPCLDALYEQRTVRVADLSTDERWSRLAARVEQVQVRSALCLQLFVEGDTLGALNLHAGAPDAFDDEAEDVALLFAAQAAIAVADAEEVQSLRTAMTSRNVIGQAQGILMERHKITAEQAFALLTRTSQVRNVKLRELAEALIFGERLHAPSRRRDRG